jgi:predicted nucleic acid-binding protein
MPMPVFMLDTSCMVAAVCTWHEHHRRASAGIEARLERGERLAVAAPTLIEAYAVLTRLPSPHRLAPPDAWSLVEANFVEHGTIVALSAAAYRRLLGRLAGQQISGGRTYDAVIAECACLARADTLLTLDRQHFDPAPPGVVVVDPSRSG